MSIELRELLDSYLMGRSLKSHRSAVRKPNRDSVKPSAWLNAQIVSAYRGPPFIEFRDSGLLVQVPDGPFLKTLNTCVGSISLHTVRAYPTPENLRVWVGKCRCEIQAA